MSVPYFMASHPMVVDVFKNHDQRDGLTNSMAKNQDKNLNDKAMRGHFLEVVKLVSLRAQRVLFHILC